MENKAGFTIWFTGIPCSGKTTISLRIRDYLVGLGKEVELLDGDSIRKTSKKRIGYSREEREAHIREVGAICRNHSKNGVVAIVALISPYESIRRELMEVIGSFFLVYVKCSLDTAVKRDVKGMYAKAMRGEIKNFTGIGAPYEVPEKCDLVLETEEYSIEECTQFVVKMLGEMGYL